MKRVIAVLAFAAILVGCSSVEVSHHGTDMVVIQNSGCFLFGCMPLFSGDPDYPNQQVCSWFTNSVSVATNMRLLDEEIVKQGARGVRNVVSHVENEGVLFCLLKRKAYVTSAELVR